MIQKMKKLTFLLTNGEYDKFISDIRQLGIVHVEELQRGATSPALMKGLALAERYKNALQILDVAYHLYGRGHKKYEKLLKKQQANGDLSEEEIALIENVKERKKALKMKGQLGSKLIDTVFSEKPAEEQRALEVLESVERASAEEIDLHHQIDATIADIRRLEPWGNIEWEKLDRIEALGYKVNFFRTRDKNFKAEWVEKYYATEVSSEGKYTYFVTFSPEQPDIAAEQIFLPRETLSDFYAKERSLNEQLTAIHYEMCRIQGEELPTLLAGQLAVENDISLSRVHLSNESVADGAVKLMVGWTLEEDAAEITKYLDQAHIYYNIENPAFDDDVPIKLKNDGFSRLFEPILRMYSLPNYHDIDPLPLFAPFFMLFFGLCMGDLGYGLLIMAISLAVVLMSPANKAYGKLGLLLGGMTCVCGFITGSFFGIDLSKVDWAFIKPIQPYFVNDSMKESFFGYSPMMVISVIIGLIQVLLGMLMAGCKAVKNYGFIYGVGKFSWVLALLCLVALFGLPMFGVVIPLALQSVLYVLIGIAAFGIYFLNNPAAYAKAGSLKKLLGIGANLGGGVWATYGMSTGLLGDLLSYIRLFALGLTGGVLGGVFNQLATQMSEGLPAQLRWGVFLGILLFGHGINFGLCLISSFVHPMRLTFVEYFKNADFSGNGKEYKPFKIIRNHD